MKVALVYDRINKWGGAERVLLSLHKIFPKADLFTSVYSSERALWAKIFNIKTSFLQNIPKASTSHGFLGTFMPLAFESFNFDKYDLVVSVTSESAKGIITKPNTLHICYCLTPTRYLWSGYETYFKNTFFRLISLPFVAYLRKWDIIASFRPDKFVAISSEVQTRIKKYYQKDSQVIFPPLMLSDSKPILPNEKDYYLIVSRLVPYKKIDIAIKTFNDLGLSLKIIGSGWDEYRLRKMAGKNIQFIKNISDRQLYGYYNNAKALVFPGVEDFGLAMAEAQFFGKPVIAFRGGGALDIVKEGITGEFFDSQTPASLKKVLEKFNPKLYNDRLCRENAEKFSFINFKRTLLEFINKQ